MSAAEGIVVALMNPGLADWLLAFTAPAIPSRTARVASAAMRARVRVFMECSATSLLAAEPEGREKRPIKRKRQRLASLALSGCLCRSLNHRRPSAKSGASGSPRCPAPLHAAAGNGGLSFLASRVLWLSSQRIFGSPQISAVLIASWRVLGSPRFPRLPAAPMVNLRVAPNLRSIRAAEQSIPGFPR